ncbi:MAG: hypothetical protein IPK16_28090 [Anaerolineales bacterium]|nr:hypothetical protein [Anaerolineales bacterium]
MLLASDVRKFDDALALIRQAVRDAQRGSQDPALAAAMEQLESALEALALMAKQGRFLEMTISNLAYADVLAGDELARVRDIVSDTIQDIERSTVAGSDGLAENELKEMRARKWLKPRLNQLVQRVELEHKAQALQAIASELSTTPITNLSKRIAAELVTDDLVQALRANSPRSGWAICGHRS